VRSISAEGQEKIRLSGYQRFLESAKARHLDRFDYSNALQTFRTQKSPEIDITCRKHGELFSITPFNHLRSSSGGCASCDKEQMRDFFLQREEGKFRNFFKKTHSPRLEIRSEFRGMTEDLEIFCNTHRSTERHKPTFLMNNRAYGCNLCAKESTGQKSRLTEERVGQQLSTLLPDHIEILSVRFDSMKRMSSVSATCHVHGEFETTMGYLKRSEHKCPKCGLEHIGYAGHRLDRLIAKGERGRPTYLAVMEIEVFGITSMKVGVTVRTLEERYRWHLRKIFCSVQIDEVDAYILENQVRRKFGNYQDLRIMKAGMRSGERWSGDTECYRFEVKDEILQFINQFIQAGESSLDYQRELRLFETPNFGELSTGRNRDESNRPIAVVGVNPFTGQVIHRFSSTSEASRAGFKNVSMVISEKYRRNLSGGLRWFKESDFDAANLDSIDASNRGNPKKVICIETEEVFDSITLAEKTLVKRGIQISGSHISSVCKGKRELAGGYHWKYAE
jgi:hypothetical protein